MVAFPAIAQLMVDKADLPIYSAKIMDPQPDSIVYSMMGGLNVPKPFSVRLEPIELELFIDEGLPERKPYVKVQLFHPDGKTLKGNATVEINDQRAQIIDHDEFNRFLEEAVYNEDFTLSAFGKGRAWLGKLKADLDLRKNVKLKGLNKLNGFNIESARLVLPPLEDGSNFIGNITLPNASDVSFEMGNVTLNLKTAGIIVGSATILDVYLTPGNNSVVANGKADLLTLIKNLPLVLQAQSQALSKGNIELQANGNSTIFDGVHIEYYERVLNNLELSASMPVLGLLVDSLGGILNGGGEGGLLGGLGGLLGNLGGGGGNGTGNSTGGIAGLTDLVSNLNVSEILPSLLGDDFNLGTLIGLLGKRAQKRMSQPVKLDWAVTTDVKGSARKAKREAEALAEYEQKRTDVVEIAKRYTGTEAYKKFVAALKAEKAGVVRSLGNINKRSDGSIGHFVAKHLKEGRSNNLNMARRSAEPAPVPVAAPAPARRHSRDPNFAPIAVANLLNKREALNRGGAYVRNLGKRGIEVAKTKRSVVDAVALTTRSPIAAAVKLLQRDTLSNVGGVLSTFGKRSIEVVKAKRAEKRAAKRSALPESAPVTAPVPKTRRHRRDPNDAKVAVAKLLNKREAINRGGAYIRNLGKRSVDVVRTKRSAVEAVEAVEVVARNPQALVASLLQRDALPKVGGLLNAFGERSIEAVKAKRMAKRSALPEAVPVSAPAPKVRRASVRKLLNKRDAINRGGAFVREAGKRGIDSLKSKREAVAAVELTARDPKAAVAALLQRDAVANAGGVLREFGRRSIDAIKAKREANAAPPAPAPDAEPLPFGRTNRRTNLARMAAKAPAAPVTAPELGKREHSSHFSPDPETMARRALKSKFARKNSTGFKSLLVAHAKKRRSAAPVPDADAAAAAYAAPEPVDGDANYEGAARAVNNLLGKKEVGKLVRDVAGIFAQAQQRRAANAEAGAEAQPNPMAMIGLLGGLLNKKSANAEAEAGEAAPNPLALLGSLVGNENVGKVMGKVLSNGKAMGAIGEFMRDPGVKEVLEKVGKMGQ